MESGHGRQPGRENDSDRFGVGGFEADAGQLEADVCAVGGGELIEDGDYRVFRRDRSTVEGDGDVEGVDDRMAEGPGCATAEWLPRVQRRGALRVDLVGERQGGVAAATVSATVSESTVKSPPAAAISAPN